MFSASFKKGASWLLGAVLALITIGGAAAAVASQVALTRDKADAVYETKERAELMYKHFEEQHGAALDEINNKLDRIAVPKE